MSLLGACLYAWNGAIESRVRLLQPHFVLVGNGAWNDLPAIAAACPLDCTFILRNMADNLIDWPVVDVVNGMLHVAHRYPYIRFVAHGLNESYGDPLRAIPWELAFIDKCRDYGLDTICLNSAYGNDLPGSYKAIAERSKYIGPHLYDGYIESEQRFVDRIYTSTRYRSNWLTDFRSKIIATEVGIESFPGTGQRRGWHDMGLSEQVVADRISENARIWYDDGVIAALWFTGGHTEASWNEGYGMTEIMARAWAKLPPPREDTVAITKDDLEAARLKIREQYLNVQRIHSAAKKNESFSEMGAELETIFDVAGKGVNVTDAEFEALVKKL